MGGRILDGKKIAEEIRGEIAADCASWIAAGNPPPCLAAILVGDDAASQVYVRNKHRACEQAGMESRLFRLEAREGEERLLQLLAHLNSDSSVNGILVQLPLPAGYRPRRVLDAINPLKDVDAFSPENVGLLIQERPRFLPCTPHGVMQLLRRCELPIAGRHVVIVGRSEIVGKPLAMLMAAKEGVCGADYANATVTIAHSRSRNLPALLQQAETIVAAVGSPKMITRQMVRPGAVVIDVGINRVGKELVGDVDFEAVVDIASAITPVPGGIGPLTIAMLLENTLRAARLQRQ